MAALLMLIVPISSEAKEVEVTGLPLALPSQQVRQGTIQSTDLLEIANKELVTAIDPFIRNRSSEPELKNDVKCTLGAKSSYVDDNSSDEEDKKKQGMHRGDERRFRDILFKTTNYTRGTDPNNFRNNQVKSVDSIPDASTLAIDAKEIHEAEEENSHTTIFCVALRDKDQYIKKFAYCNKKGVMGPRSRDKAKKLGYDVIKAERAHAEVQLLQHLLKRQKHYTHIIAMGCSRPHCAECDALLRLFLGKHYTKITAASESFGRPGTPVIERRCTPDAPFDFTLTRTSSRNYTVIQGEEAVKRDKTYDKCLLPEGLKTILEGYIGRPIELGTKYGGQLASQDAEEKVAMDTT